MKISSVSKISNKYCIQSFSSESKKEKWSIPSFSNVKPYTLENIQANYLSSKNEMLTLKSVFKKHNLPQNLLRKYGYKKEDVSPEMLEVFEKLNSGVLEHIQLVDKKGDIIPKLLTKSGEFETFWDYKGIPNLLNLFDVTMVNNKSLLSQLDDFTFVADEDFDVTEWELFLSLFDSKKVGESKTGLEKFLGETSFSELFYSKEFSPSEVLNVVDKIEESTGLGFSFSNRFYDVIDLFSSDLNEKYTPEERIKTLNYFVSLKDNEGKNIFQVENPRHSKISTYKYFMSVNPASVEASNIEMLIELVQQKVVGNHVFEYLPLDGEISVGISADIDKLYSAYIKGIEPIDEFIPSFESVSAAHKKLQTGDVYEIKGEDFIYIVNNQYSSTKLQLTKQKYFELFPPIERFGTTQNQIGNCWEISVLQGMYSNPKTRTMVLNLFSQKDNDVVVRYPNGIYGDVCFENGDLPKYEDLDSYSQGAKGFQLLEYADGKEIQASKIREYQLHLNSLEKTSPEIAKDKKNELEELLDSYGAQNLLVEYDNEEKDWIVEKYEQTPYGYNSVEVLGRDGGFVLYLLMRLGVRYIDELIMDEPATNYFLKNIGEFDSSVVFWITNHDEELCESRNLTDGHAYFLNAANYDNEGNIVAYNIINPWGIVEQRLTLEELKKYGSAIIYGKI